MSVEKVTDIGGFSRLVKEEIGFTLAVTGVIKKIPTLEATGLYVKMLTKPQNWKFHRNQMCDELDVGKDKLTSCMKVLREMGLIIDEIIRDENGRFKERIMHLKMGIGLNFNTSQTENPPPQPDLPQPDFPVSGDPAPIKRNIIKKEKEREKGKNSPLSENVKEVFSSWQRIMNKPTALLTIERASQIKKALQTGQKLHDGTVMPLTVQDLISLFEWASKDPWTMGTAKNSDRPYNDISNLLTQKKISAFKDGASKAVTTVFDSNGEFNPYLYERLFHQ